MSEEEIIVEKKDGVATVTLNRPHRHNALTRNMLKKGLPDLWSDLQSDQTVRAVIFTGAGDKAFCSGMDVREAAEDPEYGKRQDTGSEENIGSQLTARHHKFTKPVIAAVNGLCVGGGLMFVSDADFAIASENASFFNPGVNIGQLATYAPVTWTRWVPFGTIMRMMLVGSKERITAQRAYELGLVTQVTPSSELLPRCKDLALSIAENSPTAVRYVKQILWESLDHPLEDAHANGNLIMKTYSGHPDQKEGPVAFAEKRKPNWLKD